jgi:hypothetical protein
MPCANDNMADMNLMNLVSPLKRSKIRNILLRSSQENRLVSHETSICKREQIIFLQGSLKIRVWSCKVSKGVMREQEFLDSHPCDTQDSCEKWCLKSREKYHCETMQDLVPAKSNRTKGGGYDPQKGG